MNRGLGDGLRLSGGRVQPATDGLDLVAGDLRGGTEAATAHFDQQVQTDFRMALQRDYRWRA